MNAQHPAISDPDFIRAFEDCTLDPACFDHVGHLRLAVLYLQSHSLEDAIDRTCEGIRTYAESLGAAMKFHRTITTALVRIIAARLGESGQGRCDGASDRARGKESHWREFITANADLVDDGLAVLDRYYSRERLFSARARLEFVEPDISANFSGR